MTAKLYLIDVPVWATAYIKAESEEEAKRILKEQIAGDTMEVAYGPTDDRQFDTIMQDEDYVWSLSPAMTIAPWEQMEDPAFDLAYGDE